MPKEGPKSIAGINQPHNLDEIEYKSYEELSKEFHEVYPAAARAFAFIPQMYNRLTLVDKIIKLNGVVIAIQETYKFDYDASRGITLEFV